MVSELGEKRESKRKRLEMVSSVKQNWPDVSDTANASQYHTLHIQTSKESPLEVKSATSGRASSGVAGRLHVYCLNTIGELFVNDMGLLGITCFCHSTNMSVANFCEHSGSSSANPGDAVHIEDGLTLAQWCKLSFGPRALASGIWNWPTSSSAKGGSHGLNPSNLPNISKNLGSYQSPEASIGFGRSGESLNKFTYNNHLHPVAVGSYAMAKSTNSFVNIACQRNIPNQPDFFRNFSGTPPSVMPALANNHSVRSVKGSPVIINFEASNSNGNKGEQNMGYQLVGDDVNYTSKCGNPSIIYPCSSTKKSLDNDFNIRSNYSSGQFVPHWSGAPSNVELRLGQPYQKSHTLLDSIPKSKHPQQFGAHFDLPKQQFHQPLTQGTICPREENKPWPNLQCTLPEASTPERRNLQHATSSASACNLSEPEETTGIAAKNSAISLFLSHLNYIEGNNLSHSTDNILNDTENVVMEEYDDDSTKLGRFSNNNAMEGVKHEMYNQKERRSSFPGKCSCTLSTCLAACISGDSPCACKELEVSRKANTLPFNDDRSFKDNKIMKQGRCECSRKHVIMSNDSQSALWRNIPSEVIGQSDAVLIEESAKVLEATGVVDQPTEASVKEYDKACEQHELMKEQQMSNACSESSAPAITEISSETNKVGFCAAEVGNAKSICDFVVDEGSGIEKCGSSDEALDNQEWEEAISFRNKVDSVCLFEEHKLQSSSTSKNVKNQKKSGFIIQEEINQMQRMCREEKLKGPMKWKRLDACNPISGLSIVNADCLESIGHHSSSKGIKAPVQQDNRKTSCVFFCKASGAKRKRSTRSLKRFENHHKVQEHGKTESSDDCSPKVMRLSALKKVKQDLVVDGKKESVKQKDNHETSGKPPKYMSLGCIGNSPNHGMDSYVVKVKPVVCGNSGIISNVLGSEQKPPKIVSLSVILKTARRCNISKDEWKPELSSVSETKKVRLSANTRRCSELSWKKQSQNGDSNVFLRSRKGPRFLIMPGVNKICSSKGDGCVDEVSAMKRGTDCENLRTLKHGDHHDYIDSQPRYDGTRKRSLSELTGEDMHAAKSTCLSSIGENSNLIIAGTELEKPPSQCITDSLIGRDLHCEKSCSGKILDSASPRNIGVISKSQFYRDHEQCQINMRRCSKRRKCQPFVFNSDAFCCVCGSSNKEEGNNLLECFHCLIRVHQACYGIPKAPKDRWCCRPCKANAKNIVCVLCGYEGGAMTRALKSRNVVKSLLKVWKIGIDSKPGKSVPPKMSKFPEPGLLGKTSGDNGSSLLALVGSASSGDVLRYSPKMDLQSRTNMFRQMDILSSYQSHNSITAGMLDPSVIQWVHMVCGLWTPGTKCPNVDTMSAFDVSGASPARKNTVCSICNRPGGSCIRCRVLNCTVNFHPWCAHQKGLLQSEVEGVDNEKVGFYGRCMLHVMHNSFHVDGSMDVEVGSSIQKDFSCARVEGFKGRKRDEGYKPHFQKPYNGGGCIVSQDQINAWIHINGQKSCTRSVVKPACSDIEYDFRKEYIRYKQAKGWRHLVVYKSGIHALGLYTSQFIARGAMVVEYVGEIVGLRVADKREIEYQSGRKMQYKSACYFFRIDKEHIIDATRKGGIARFVNHSCLPNCVAKIISIRNEKKVVFFAERDINPGEEITYDYHFNHEDEGQKIPCFCNSKNCRRYLN